MNRCWSLLLIFSLSLPLGALASIDRLLATEKASIELYKRVVPSVVNVSNMKSRRSLFFSDAPQQQGQGSGFVWDENGHIVTNYHVIEGGDKFLVSFHDDKTQYEASVVGVEPNLDVAVLKLTKRPKTLVPVKVGTSKDLQVGQIAVAIGNPFGLDHSMSMGIISATGRAIEGFGGVTIRDMIQTDAAINMGNSGGPMLNSAGELIGMNTMIFSTSGSSAGLGFAVPVDTVNRAVPELIKYGKIIRPGILITPLNPRVARRFSDKGVMIESLDPKGPAGKAGLRGLTQDRFGRIYPGDIIEQVDGIEVNSLDDLYHTLGKYKIGDQVTVTFNREGKTMSKQVTLESLRR